MLPKSVRRIEEISKNYVKNEVVITSVPNARNDSLPHYLNVAARTVNSEKRYGDVAIDGILSRAPSKVRSVARVFVPRDAIAKVLAGTTRESRAKTKIPSTYKADEDKFGLSRTYKVTFEDEINVPQMCSELTKSKAVQKAKPNYIARVFKQPNDQFFGVQWGLQAIHCPQAWDIEEGDPSVIVGIVDSGVDLQHEDLMPKLLTGSDFVDYQGSSDSRYTLLGDYQTRDEDPDDEDGHGSHCAGIAAAESNNGIGVTGVCWKSKILPVRVMFRVFDNLKQHETSVGTDVDIDAGIKWAIDSGANVINLSLGGEDPSHEQVLDYAMQKNVCVIAATGNENSNSASYPASNINTLAVGAVDSALNRANFSNYGPAYNRFVVAPGVEIGSSYKENGYVYLSGTSMATPFVTGLAALLIGSAKKMGATLTVLDVYETIRSSATPLGSGKGDTFYGEGLVNAEAALNALSELINKPVARVRKVRRVRK